MARFVLFDEKEDNGFFIWDRRIADDAKTAITHDGLSFIELNVEKITKKLWKLTDGEIIFVSDQDTVQERLLRDIVKSVLKIN